MGVWYDVPSEESVHKDIVLSDTAEDLYKKLGGIDERDGVIDDTKADEGLVEILAEEEKALDGKRGILVEMAYLLSGFLNNSRMRSQQNKKDEDLTHAIEAIVKVAHIAGKEKTVLIRYRGSWQGGEKVSESKSDFTITAGAVIADIPITKAISRRRGITASHLPGRLTTAFELLSTLNIYALRISLGEGHGEDLAHIKLSMGVLSDYFREVLNSHSGALNSLNDKSFIVYNEYNQPDPNLTMLARVNNLKCASVQEIVGKVDEMMKDETVGAELERFPSVYDAIFAFKKFKGWLVRPAVEVNNIRWMMVERGQSAISNNKAKISREVMDIYKNSHQRAADVMNSMYVADYRDINANNLQKNIDSVSELVTLSEKDNTRREALKSIYNGLNKTPDDVFDLISIENGRIALPNQKSGALGALLNKDIKNIISFFKRRAKTKGKIRRMLHETIDFDAQDIDIIARDFQISVPDAKNLLLLLKECFTNEGRFQRNVFETYIPEFAKYEKKVFGFLWRFLKEIKFRDDRLNFLNSLQLLISKMSQQENGLESLVHEFIKSPDRVDFSDRNALILSNLLVRKYNKELNVHIEITPEEVLMVRDGLNMDIVRRLSNIVDNDQDRFLKKITTLHTMVGNSIINDENQMPFRFLITAERELYIFLSLIGGETAHKILRSAVHEYGNPRSELYGIVKSPDQMKSIFQMLQVSIRGLKRFNAGEDDRLFLTVKRREEMFMETYPKLLQRELVTRTMIFAGMPTA